VRVAVDVLWVDRFHVEFLSRTKRKSVSETLPSPLIQSTLIVEWFLVEWGRSWNNALNHGGAASSILSHEQHAFLLR
jgi:hypothetical protein